jgi:ATP-dependent HslUV protease subunit HslV
MLRAANKGPPLHGPVPASPSVGRKNAMSVCSIRSAVAPSAAAKPGEARVKWRATTILSVRRDGRVALGGDGQVTLGTTIMKADAVKIRKLLDGQVLVGFAGSAADGFALLERFETKLKDYPNNVPRAATELAKLWRTDRMLRRLEALLVVADARHSLLLSGSGDVIQPSDGILSAGSGGGYALAAARALLAHSGLSAVEVVRESLAIAGGIDIYTNSHVTVEELVCPT